jgi:hypothetical protein
MRAAVFSEVGNEQNRDVVELLNTNKYFKLKYGNVCFKYYLFSEAGKKVISFGYDEIEENVRARTC